MRFY
jgi:hypothetical protein